MTGATAMPIGVGLVRAIGSLLLLTTLATPLAAEPLWEHNGSILRLRENGAERSFEYLRPRAELRKAGVTNGSALFVGRKIGDRFSGTAHLFSKRCGAIAYIVEGSVSADSRRVTLSGRAPRRNSKCQVIGHRDDMLVFSQQGRAEQQSGSANSVDDSIAELQPKKQEPDKSPNDDSPGKRVPEDLETGPATHAQTARLLFPVMGCKSRATFDQWVETFRRADAAAEAQVVAQGMKTKDCAALNDGPVAIVQGDDTYLCVRPKGKADCYWTLRASVK